MGISDENLLSGAGRLTPKQADRFTDILADAMNTMTDPLDELIAETEWRVDRWAERIADMVLLHVRRTGRKPNAVWLPERFYELRPSMLVRCSGDSTHFNLNVRNVENIESIYGVESDDLVIGRAEPGRPKAESFFVERNCGPQVV